MEFVDPPAECWGVEESGLELVVGKDVGNVGQGAARVVGEARGIGEKRGSSGGDDRVGEEEGVEGDVGASEVEEPGDGVEGGDGVRFGAGACEVVAQRGEFVLHGGAGERGRVGADGLGWVRGSVGPGCIDQVAWGVNKGNPARREGLLKVKERAPRDGARVDGDDGSLGEAREVFAERGDGVRTGSHQREKRFIQLLFGLRPVSAVGPEERVFGGDEGVACRAGKTRDECASFRGCGRVFGLMFVGAWDEERVDGRRGGAHGAAELRECVSDV